MSSNCDTLSFFWPLHLSKVKEMRDSEESYPGRGSVDFLTSEVHTY